MTKSHSVNPKFGQSGSYGFSRLHVLLNPVHIIGHFCEVGGKFGPTSESPKANNSNKEPWVIYAAPSHERPTTVTLACGDVCKKKLEKELFLLKIIIVYPKFGRNY